MDLWLSYYCNSFSTIWKRSQLQDGLTDSTPVSSLTSSFPAGDTALRPLAHLQSDNGDGDEDGDDNGDDGDDDDDSE